MTDVTDDTGSVLASYEYDVFGAIRAQTGSSDNYWLVTGEQHDADGGLYYLRARFYDPEIGRFLTRDPLPGSTLNAQTQNRYSYVGNNPVNRVDPRGLAWEGGFSPPGPIPTPTLTPTPIPTPCPTYPIYALPPTPYPTPTPTPTPVPDGVVPAPLPIPLPIPGIGVSDCEGWCGLTCASLGCGSLCATYGPPGLRAKLLCTAGCSVIGCNTLCKKLLCPGIGNTCPPTC